MVGGALVNIMTLFIKFHLIFFYNICHKTLNSLKFAARLIDLPQDLGSIFFVALIFSIIVSFFIIIFFFTNIIVFNYSMMANCGGRCCLIHLLLVQNGGRNFSVLVLRRSRSGYGCRRRGRRRRDAVCCVGGGLDFITFHGLGDGRDRVASGRVRSTGHSSGHRSWSEIA